ncbi:MAG: lasso peptide biosynthesis B2 protein [Blastocatellia bacterium]
MQASRLRKFGALSWAEKLVFLRACVTLPLIAIVLWRAGLARCQRWITGVSAKGAETPALDRALKTARLINAAAHHGIYRANCLERSLALAFELRRNGIESQLRIGVSSGNGFQAHAWIEMDGVVLNDSPFVAGEYKPFAETIALQSKGYRIV